MTIKEAILKQVAYQVIGERKNQRNLRKGDR